jgi:hypothetical protein
MEYRQIDLSTNAFGLGNMLGTSGSAELIKLINYQTGGGSSYYGSDNDPYRNNYYHFMQNIVNPIRETHLKLQAAKMTIEQPDTYRVIDSIEELEKGIPPCMYDAIVTFPPIRKLAQAGKIEAFGLDVNNYPLEDVYGRLIDNGTVVLLPENIKDGMIELKYKWVSTDPDLSIDEIEIVRETREFLDEFLTNKNTEHIDPTSIPYGALRG